MQPPQQHQHWSSGVYTYLDTFLRGICGSCRINTHQACSTTVGSYMHAWIDSGDFATSSEPLASTEVGTSATPVAKTAPGPSPSGPVQLDNVKNIRDLCTVRDANIKPGRVYRTGYLSKASKADVSFSSSLITRQEHPQTRQTKNIWVMGL